MDTTAQVKLSSRSRSRVGWLKWAAIALVVRLVVAYLTIGAIAADRLTKPMHQFPPALPPAPYQDVRFPVRGGDVEIAAWYLPSDGSHRAVVLVHGKDSSRAHEFSMHFVDLAGALRDRGMAVLMIDLRGHSESGDGRFSFGLHERRDVQGAVDWLQERGFRPGGIGALAISMGAASSVGAAADESDIGALVTDSGYEAICPLIRQEWRKASGLPNLFLPGMLLMHRVMFGYDVAASRPVDEIDAIPPRRF